MYDPETHVGKEVYLVRHGQSAANMGPYYQPSDSVLTERGEREAMLVARHLGKIGVDLVISSPYARAIQTTNHILAALPGHAPVVSDLFEERRKPSSISNLPYTDEIARKIYSDWERSLLTTGLKVKDGENYDELVARADEALEFLEGIDRAKIAVVTHGNFMRTIFARVILRDALTPQSLDAIQRTVKIGNTGIVRLRYGEPFYDETSPSWNLEAQNELFHMVEPENTNVCIDD